VDALAVVHRDAVITGYSGIFPPEATIPTLDALRSEWRRALADVSVTTFVADADGAVVGMVMVRADPDFEDCGQLRRLNVAPQWWGTGVGTRLHDEALHRLHETGFATAGLWVLEGNHRPRQMYERRNWVLVPGVILEWPELGVTEVRYTRPLQT
jgi:GNAT superfamily N-acetyltransferase